VRFADLVDTHCVINQTQANTNPHHRRNRCLSTLLAAITLVMPMLAGTASALQSVNVKWNANPETDIAGYTLYLGTKSGFYSTTLNVVSGTSATLSGLSFATTYYAAVQAYNTAGVTSELSDEISFMIPPPEFYADWSARAGLTGANAAPGAMPFNDGVPNLLKYAFNMNGSGPDRTVLASGTGNSGLAVFTMGRNGDQAVVRVEYVRLKASEVLYTPKISTDLKTYVPMTGTITVTSIDPSWERMVIEKPVDLAKTPRLFGIVEVSSELISGQ
jgi:hypothetical protein